PAKRKACVRTSRCARCSRAAVEGQGRAAGRRSFSAIVTDGAFGNKDGLASQIWPECRVVAKHEPAKEARPPPHSPRLWHGLGAALRAAEHRAGGPSRQTRAAPGIWPDGERRAVRYFGAGGRRDRLR